MTDNGYHAIPEYRKITWINLTTQLSSIDRIPRMFVLDWFALWIHFHYHTNWRMLLIRQTLWLKIKHNRVISKEDKSHSAAKVFESKTIDGFEHQTNSQFGSFPGCGSATVGSQLMIMECRWLREIGRCVWVCRYFVLRQFSLGKGRAENNKLPTRSSQRN